MNVKKLFCVFGMMCAAIFFCACSPSDSVEKFYNALYDGDFQEAKRYCSDDAVAALDEIIQALDGEGADDALERYRRDMAFEKKYFRFLSSAEVDYQISEDEKLAIADAKQKKDTLNKAKNEQELKEIQEAHAKEAAEKAEFAGAKIVYTKWSKDIVYKHYLKLSEGRWKIVKIEFGHALPENLY